MTNGLFGGCFGHFSMSHLLKQSSLKWQFLDTFLTIFFKLKIGNFVSELGIKILFAIGNLVKLKQYLLSKNSFFTI